VTAWQIVGVLYAVVLGLAGVAGLGGWWHRPEVRARRRQRRADRARVRAEVAEWLTFAGIAGRMPDVAERGRRVAAADPYLIPQQREGEE
jgi:hypothetical protein